MAGSSFHSYIYIYIYMYVYIYIYIYELVTFFTKLYTFQDLQTAMSHVVAFTGLGLLTVPSRWAAGTAPAKR